MKRLHRYFKHVVAILMAVRHYGLSGPVLIKAWNVWRRHGLGRLLAHASGLSSRSQDVISSSRPLDSGKASILVVTHEASRTGVPVLSLNLVNELSKRYNVVVLLLGDGPLIEAFSFVATELHIDPISRSQPAYAQRVINSICERHELLGAIVNSIESRVVLAPLARNFVPTISLLHEFASNTRPHDAFAQAFIWASEVVFSTRLTMENAMMAYPDASHRQPPVQVIPQGRCAVLREERDAELIDAERAFIAARMRPKSLADGAIVVLGAGTVQHRKGVDLFLECATRVAKSPGGENCRFVWFGAGYDPEVDMAYSVYLADQIRRAGLEQRVAIVRETSEIEEAYKAADVFLLASRLDPLPNVAIDAMSLGLPVVCFDETTGIADILVQHGLRGACVADYLDTHDLAQKVLALSTNSTHRKSVGDQCREIAQASFQMGDYVVRLEALMLAAHERKKKEKVDVQTVLESGKLLPGFAAQAHLPKPAAAMQYVRVWQSGLARRKPFPGFHPGVYREYLKSVAEENDPLISYLRAGQPDGSWVFPVIGPDSGVAALDTKTTRVALHLHAYYADMLGQITQRLERNQIRPDLFVSVKDEASKQTALDALRAYQGRVVDVRVVPNRGRDIGPLLTAFGDQLVRDYDIVGHLHTKKSFDIQDREAIDAWYAFLLENLLGGKVGGHMADAVIAYMADHPTVGLVFPDDPNVIGWSRNRACAEPLAKRLGLSELPNDFSFPVGTMFWARTAVLKPFVALGLAWDDYPPEPLPYDGTMLHAMERLFGLVPATQGLHCAVTHVPGVTR